MNLNNLSNADLKAMLLKLVTTEDAPAVKATPKRKPAGKAKPVAKPKSKGKAKPAAKADAERESFEGNGVTLEIGSGSRSKSGHVYAPFFVGGKYVGSLRISDKAAIRTLAKVLRSEAAKDVVAHCDLQADA